MSEMFKKHQEQHSQQLQQQQQALQNLQQQQKQQGNIGIYNNNKMNVIPNYTLSGMSSFDAESLPDYSEFDSESVTLDYYKERYIANKYNTTMSITTTTSTCILSTFCFDSVLLSA